MHDLFSRFGLDEKETYAFLELVRIGAVPVSVWAKQAGMKRSTMYVVLERLNKLGLVSSFTHKGIGHVQAIPMSELFAFLNDREDELASTQALLQKRLPELIKLEKNPGITPKVRFYEGHKKVEVMYEEVLKEASFKAFFHPGRVKKFMLEYFHKIPEMLKKRGGTAQELLIRCSEAEEYKKLYNSHKHQIALLPKEINFSSDTIITTHKIFLVGYSEKDVVGTEIWNSELAQTQSILFDLVWSKHIK